MQKPEKSFLPENIEEISITRMYQIFLVEYIEICRMNQVESSSLVSVLFREAISHPYISFFHLLVNGFSVTISVLF